MIAKVRAFQEGRGPLLKVALSISGPDTVIKASSSFSADSISMSFSAFEWEGRNNLEVFAKLAK